MSKAAALALHLPDAVEPHGHDGKAQIFGEQSDARLKRRHAAVLRIVHHALGKNEQTVAAVDGFPRKAKTLAEAGKLRQRENVEKRGDQPVAKLIGPALCKKPLAGRAAHILQTFAAHRHGETMAKTKRQRRENQPDVRAARNVIRNDEHGAVQAAQMFAPHDSRMAQNLRGWPNQRIVNREAQPAHRLALRPTRINVFGAASGRFLQQALDVGDGLGLGERRFAEFHVERFFKGAHQLDAIERSEIQLLLQMILLRAEGGESGEQAAQRTCFRRGCASPLLSTKNLGCARGDLAEARLAGRSARKIQIVPNGPGANALVFRKRRIGSLDGCPREGITRLIQQQYGASLGIAIAFDWNDDAIAHARLLAQGGFQILGINIQPRWRDNHIFLAPPKTQVAFGIECPQIACVQPAFFAARLEGASLPVACGDVFSAHENFTVFAKHEFPAGKNFADGAFRRAKGMIQADQRSRLRHAIALNHGVTHTLEKILGFTRKRGASGDKSPKLPAKAAMNATKHPRSS